MRFVSFIAALVSFAFAAVAQPLALTHVIRDGAQRRHFVVATNELHIGGERIEGISPQPSGEALCRQAKMRAAQGDAVDLVLYPADARPADTTRRLLTKQVLVEVQAGTDVAALARAVEGRVDTTLPFAPGMHLLSVSEPGAALRAAEKLRRMPGVVSAEPQLARRVAKKFIPDDPLFPQQWHLRNTGQFGGTAGIDIDVVNVWDRFRGSNVVIGIVDDGLQGNHPDIMPNISAALSWDFRDNDNNPSPHVGTSCDFDSDCHGTAAAGVAAARGNNETGVTGAAFEATLAGLRLIGGYETDGMEAAAILHSNNLIHIKSNSWGAPDCDPNFGDRAILDGAGPLLRAALREGVRAGRNGRGVIYPWAGGNGLECEENVNYDGYANRPEVLAVGAISDLGQQADYSEPGACLVVVAPSSTFGRQEITTVDLTGTAGYNADGGNSGDVDDLDYTRTFTGTSSATPLVAGVVALVLQANPELGYRDVKEVLMRSARKVQPANDDWATNNAGIAHNHKFGAGLINAEAAVNLATNWLPLDALTNISLVQTNLNQAIADNDLVGVTRSFAFNSPGFRVENVTVTMTAPHPYWGDLAVTLTSPAGMQSRLAEVHHANRSYQYEAWTFNTVRHWGEAANGTWTVTVADGAAEDTGTLDALEVTLYGSLPRARLEVAPAGPDVIVTLRAPAVGWRYAIESADQLPGESANWTQAAVATVPVGGSVSVTDTNALTLNHRFYRARSLQ